MATNYELRFLHPTQQKISHFGDIPQANLLAGMEKLNLTQQSQV